MINSRIMKEFTLCGNGLFDTTIANIAKTMQKKKDLGYWWLGHRNFGQNILFCYVDMVSYTKSVHCPICNKCLV